MITTDCTTPRLRPARPAAGDRTATVPPASPPAARSAPRGCQERLHLARQALMQERALGGDYYPCDDEIISDWAAIRNRSGPAHAGVIELLDDFLIRHLDTVRDLMLRARCGRAPTRLLDELEHAVAAACDQLSA